MLKKERIELVITGFLVLALFLAVASAAKKKKPLKPKIFTPGLADAGERPAGNDLFFQLEKESESIAVKRDPFSLTPISSSNISADRALSLSGIMWEKKEPVAIINEAIVGLGASISGYKVLEIKKDRVVLSDGTRQIELELGQ